MGKSKGEVYMKIVVGNKICYEVKFEKYIVRRKGIVKEEYPDFYVVEVTVPAHKDSYEKTRTFKEAINKKTDMRVFSYIETSL